MNMEKTNLPFAGLVQDRMKEKGISLRELCRGVPLDPSFFSKVLSGKRSPPGEEAVLRKLAALLDLDPGRVIVAAGRIPSDWQSDFLERWEAKPPRPAGGKSSSASGGRFRRSGPESGSQEPPRYVAVSVPLAEELL